MKANIILKSLTITIWLICLCALLVAGYIEKDIIKNNQNMASSAEHPAKLVLKNKEFNVTRQQKLLYENSELFILVMFLLGALIYRIRGTGKSQYKTLPPMQAIEGTSATANRPMPTPPSESQP